MFSEFYFKAVFVSISVGSNEFQIVIEGVQLRKLLRGKDTVIDEDLLLLVEEQEPWLHPALKQFANRELADIPTPWRMLLHDLFTGISAVGLIDPTTDVYSFFDKLLSKPMSTDLLTDISKYLPVIYAVLRLNVNCIDVLTPIKL